MQHLKTITVSSCPECGGLAEIARNGDWKCTAHDRVKGFDVLVCAARGVSLGEDLCITHGSNHLWRVL